MSFLFVGFCNAVICLVAEKIREKIYDVLAGCKMQVVRLSVSLKS